MIQKKLMTDITRIQQKAVKLIGPMIPVSDTFAKYNILTFEKMVKLEQCKLCFKLCNNLLPPNLAKSMRQDHRMQSTSKSHRYHTRNKQIPNLPQVTTDKYQTSFLF